MFSPLTVVTTLIVLPVTIVILWIGYAALLIGTVVPPMAEPISRLLAGLGEFTVRTVLAIDQWPLASITLPRLGVFFTLAATIVVIYWLIRGHVRDGRGYLGAVLIAVWLAALLFLGPRLAPGVPYRLDILAMGDAQCQLLRTGEHAVLIGAGQPGHTPRPEQLVRTLRQLDAPRIQTVVIPDLRQQTWSGLPGILDRLRIRTVLVPPALPNAAILDPNGPHARLLRTLYDRRIIVRSIDIGDRFSVGDLVVSVVGPSGRPAPQRRLCLRIDGPADRGAVLLGASSTISDIAAIPAADRRCDAMILPTTFRASEKPAESIRLSRAFALIHSGSALAAADVSQRIADAAHIRFTSVEGAMRIEPASDGRLTITPIR